MDKFIGFDIDHKNTVACVTQAGREDRYTKLKTEVGALRRWLQANRQPQAQRRLIYDEARADESLFP